MAPNLTALVSSRICHDIISPIGAIANGIELLEMSGLPPGPEMDLISQSSAAASDTVRVLRLAFGPCVTDVSMSPTDLQEILTAHQRTTRVSISSTFDTDLSRGLGKLAILAVMCVETSLVGLGDISVRQVGKGLEVIGSAPSLRDGAQTRLDLLNGIPLSGSLEPAFVQFPLSVETAAELGLTPSAEATASKVVLRFS